MRYAVRELNPATIDTPNPGILSEVYTEYDGNLPYNTYTMDLGEATILESYQPGIGKVSDPLGSPASWYYHTDKLGTTRGMTGAPSSLIETSVYTAFGELVDGTNHRYGYIGSEGYQAHDEFPLLHVGTRYYDPGIGRFLQRDGIGILGGTNVYAYVYNRPTAGVDPMGHGFWSAIGGAISGALSGAISGAISGAVTGLLVGGPAGALAGIGAGAAAGAISGGIAGTVTGLNSASSFGGGLASGASAGALAGIGGGAVGGAIGAGAGVGAIVVAGSLGGAISSGGAAAVGGAGPQGIAGAAAVGAAAGAGGGAVSAGGQLIIGCVYEADAALFGDIFARW